MVLAGRWIAKAAVNDYPLSTAVKHKRLIVVSTGTDNCVIDLRQVLPEAHAFAQCAGPPNEGTHSPGCRGRSAVLAFTAR